MFRRLILVSTIAIAALCLAAPSYAQGAQSQPNTGLGIGALGGLTFTSPRTENSIETSSGNGFMFGIWFGGNRDGRVGLMGELSYVTKKVEASEDGETAELTNKYVEIPVLVRINAGSRSREGANFYILLGPVFDIKIKGLVKVDGQEIDTPDDTYQGLDIGFLAGAGFEVVRVGVEVRYSWGLRSVLGTDAAIDSGFGSTKYNTLQILAKIRFN